MEVLLTTSGSDPKTKDNKEHDLQYYKEHRDEISIPKWSPRPIPAPLPPSPKKSPLKKGEGMERANMSLKAKKEEREAKEGRI